jgi:hypothetical protein
MRFPRPDPLTEKYHSVSPFAYCRNNPVNNIDLQGDSVTVLNLKEGEHSAMLIQNDAGKWQYYSMNGDWVYEITGGWKGGKPYHDMGEKTFNSPQEFLKSSYNAEGNKEQINDNTVNNYGFTEGYILPTTPEQDNVIISTFTDAVNQGYSLTDNQCSIAVQKGLNAVGIKTTATSTTKSTRWGETFQSTRAYNPYLPSRAFKAIINNNPNGSYIRR